MKLIAALLLTILLSSCICVCPGLNLTTGILPPGYHAQIWRDGENPDKEKEENKQEDQDGKVPF